MKSQIPPGIARTGIRIDWKVNTPHNTDVTPSTLAVVLFIIFSNKKGPGFLRLLILLVSLTARYFSSDAYSLARCSCTGKLVTLI